MSETVGSLPREEAKLINPVVLAFVGDAVYSLYVRKKLVLAGGRQGGRFSTRRVESGVRPRAERVSGKAAARV